MKIALCVSGQPRGLETAFEYIQRNLTSTCSTIRSDKPCDGVDVFIHSWIPAVDGFEDRIDYLYNPVRVRYMEYFSPKYFERYTRIASPKHPPFNTAHMLASVFYANELKREYELQCGFKYDIVVRTRFDYALNRTLPLSEADPSKLYVPNCRMDDHRVMCNDQFAWGSSEVMDLYSQTFQNLDRLYQMGFIYNGEDMLSGNLQLNNLTGQHMVYVDMNNPFPPGPYNGTTHSLVRDDFRSWNELRG